MANFKQKKFTSDSGKDFTFQFPGIRAAAQISDRTKNKHGHVSEEKLADEMMKHVIVEPKMTFESFESKSEFNEVIAAAYKFLEGSDDEEPEDDNQ